MDLMPRDRYAGSQAVSTRGGGNETDCARQRATSTSAAARLLNATPVDQTPKLRSAPICSWAKRNAGRMDSTACSMHEAICQVTDSLLEAT